MIMTRILVLVFIMVSMLLPAGCTTGEPEGKLDTVRLVGTIGPLSIPLAYMVENDVLADIAEETTLAVWSTPAQLQAIIAGGQGHFFSLPVNSAATFYNKGIDIKLLDCSIWNILFAISNDPDIESAADLAGKRVLVPYQGAVPDAIFQYALNGQGVNPVTGIDIVYAPDPVQASQLLLSGQEHYALLSEPSATSVIKKAGESGITLYRNLDMNTEWQKASGGKSRPAIAGTVALGDIAENRHVVERFREEYRKAIDWMLDNPQQAGEIGARVLAEQGFTAAVLTESMQNIDWDYVTADKAYEDIVDYFSALMELSPDYIGGKLPDDAFYYGRN